MKRLYRNKKDSVITGVCSGLAQHLEIDPTLVRLGFVLLALFNGFGVLLYLIMAIVVPARPDAGGENEPASESGESAGRDLSGLVGILGGITLIVLGGLALLRNLNIRLFWWLNFNTLWPLLLVVGGVALLLHRTDGRGE